MGGVEERSPASEAWAAMRRMLLSGEGHRRILSACGAAGLTPGLLKMAMQLSTDRPQAMRDLAVRLHVDASYVTSVVDGLEEQGIAERRPHPSDRRVKTVVLTEHGERVLRKVNDTLDVAPSAFDVLDASEQAQLRDLLVRVAAAADAAAEAAFAATGGPARPADA
jgi:DNA-binding MarR family transcriptional regulator